MENPVKINKSTLKEGDIILICKDCGREFIFTDGEQKFYATRTPPLNPPKRCGMCRYKKKERYKLKEKENYERPNNAGKGSPANTQPIETKSPSV